MDGKMVIFSAPSGSGKSTIINHLLEKELPLEFSISATTRSPRGGEKHGSEYYFFSPDEFRQKIAKDEFIEWEEVYTDRYYGTLKSEINRIWSEGKHVIFDVDVVGGLNLKKLFPEKALSVFIQAPSVAVLKERLMGRATDSAEEIEKRIAKAEEEMAYAPKFDTVVVNDNLQEACEKMVAIVSDFLKA